MGIHTPIKVSLAKEPLRILQSLRIPRRNAMDILPQYTVEQPIVISKVPTIVEHMISDL